MSYYDNRRYNPPADVYAASTLVGQHTGKGEEAPLPAPIDMVLHCPECHTQHIDKPEWFNAGPDERGRRTPSAYTWTNPPHRSHRCAHCGTIWRPADVPTNGVAAVKTKGKADTWPRSQSKGE